MTSSGGDLTLRSRVTRAAWVGWAGGTLFGVLEAWGILSRNAAATNPSLIGVIAAMGFVVALDGAVGTLGLGLVGLVTAQIGWLRRHFSDSAAWTAHCAAWCIALLTVLLALDQFGVLNGAVAGARAAIFAGVSLVSGIVAGASAWWVTRGTLASQYGVAARPIRRVLAAAWLIAALLPLAYALIRSRLG